MRAAVSPPYELPSRSPNRSLTPSSFPSVLPHFRAVCGQMGVRIPRSLEHQLAPLAYHVERLQLRRTVVPARLAKALSRVLTQLPMLELLDFDGSELSYVATEHIVDALCTLPPLSRNDPFVLRMPGTDPGPRTLRHLRRLRAQRPDIEITGTGSIVVTPDESKAADDVNDYSIVEGSPGTPPKRGSSAGGASGHSSVMRLDRKSTAAYMSEPHSDGDDDLLLEEEELEHALAERLDRLCRPVDALRQEKLAARIAALEAEEAEERAEVWNEYVDGLEGLEHARSFELPFKAPYFDPDGLMCSPLRHRGNGGDDTDEAELQALKAKLFAAEDALRRHTQLSAGGTIYGVDGRPLRRQRLLEGETLEEAARRLDVPVHEVLHANADTAMAAVGAERIPGTVLVPMSLEALLLDQLTSERAAAVRMAEAEAARQVAVASGEECEIAAATAAWNVVRTTLHERTVEREKTQAKLRGLEIALYERKRDGWLRFLRRQELLLQDHAVASAALLLEHEEVLAHYERQALHEAAVIRRHLEAARLPPEEVELQALRSRAKRLTASCSKTRSPSPARRRSTGGADGATITAVPFPRI